MMDGGGHQRRKIRFLGAEVNASEQGLPLSFTFHALWFTVLSPPHLIVSMISSFDSGLLSLCLR